MIAKVEEMNMRQENYKEGQETKDMLKNHMEKESETMLVQLKEVMDDHKNISLPEILKEKQHIVTGIEDFYIDCVLDEETHVNIMPESTWEILGNPAMIPSFGRIGLFKGKTITLCGIVANIHMIAHEKIRIRMKRGIERLRS
jgi:hypothetical protein